MAFKAEGMITNLQNTVISDKGLMGIIFFNLFNTFAQGSEIKEMQSFAQRMFDTLKENKEILSTIREGIEKGAKKSWTK